MRVSTLPTPMAGVSPQRETRRGVEPSAASYRNVDLIDPQLVASVALGWTATEASGIPLLENETSEKLGPEMPEVGADTRVWTDASTAQRHVTVATRHGKTMRRSAAKS
jgi:hypothetical protein